MTALTLRKKPPRGPRPGKGRNASPRPGGLAAGVAQALQSALQRQLAGDLAAAEALYDQVLSAAPGTPDALHLLGVVHLKTGRPDSACNLLGRAVAAQPRNANFRINYGAVLQALARHEEAAEQYRAALALKPGRIATYLKLAAVQKQLGQIEAAIETCLAAVRQDPSALRIHKILADLYLGQERYAEARDHLLAYLAAEDRDADAHNKLGCAEHKLDRLEAAEAVLRRATELAPEDPDYLANRAIVLRALGRLDEAEALLRRAAALAPDNFGVTRHLVKVLMDLEQFEEGIAILRRLLEQRSDDAALWNGLGMALRVSGDPGEGRDAFLKAIEIDPDFLPAHENLTLCCLGAQDYGAAIASLRETLRRHPRNLQAHLSLSDLLATMGKRDEANLLAHAAMMLETYEPKYFWVPFRVFQKTCDFDGLAELGDIWSACEETPPNLLPVTFLDMLTMADGAARNDRMVRLHRKWAVDVEALAAESPLPPVVTEGRGGRIRLGFLSSDLRIHSVAKFVLPLLRHYDRDRFEIFCYAPFAADGDPIQQHIRSLVSKFTVLRRASDREIAAAIRADGVDVLVELNGFTRDTRLNALVYRPAPVQVSWLGYPFTSGLPQIDYIVVDRFAKPLRDDLLVEKPLELAGSWACFGALEDVPVGAPPCEANGFVTFGTLNNSYKYQPDAIALWAEVMHRVPDSRFLMVRPEGESRRLCHHLVNEFGKNGISGDRLFVLKNPKLQHLPCYNQIDVSLDTFPLTGGTTTCDALWMGVPVVTLRGESFHQRLSHSYVNHAGLGDLSCDSPEAYVRTAVALAQDRERLRTLRRDLRPFLRDSDLCRGDRFTAHFQNAIEDIVRRHGLR